MSSLARYIVDAVVLEGRSPTQLARDHGITRRWIHKLVKRFREGGYSALEPRSGRPHSCSHQISSDVQAKVLRLRQELVAAGHDAGPETIAHHLIGHVDKVPSAATVWRILKRNGLITPQPHKRPKSSFIRFEAKLPNETWQLDSTPWQLADDSPVEILNFLDDKSRNTVACQTFCDRQGSGSTLSEESHCATSVGCATSRSATRTRTARSDSSSPVLTSASSRTTESS